MEKDQAVQFILQQYEQGYSPDEIALQLSQELKAPVDVVNKFVAVTLKDVPAPDAFGGFAASAPAEEALQEPASTSMPYTAQQEDEIPDFSYTADDNQTSGYVDLDDLDSFPSAAAPASAVTLQDFDEEELVEVDGQVFSKQEYSTAVFLTGGAPATPQPGAGPDGADLIPSPYGVKPGQPVDAVHTTSQDELRALEEDPEIVKLVMRELGRTSKVSDVVMVVAERTGLDWKDAQRLVGRIQARNRKTIAARQNRLIIPFSLAALIGGVLLVLAGVLELLQMRTIYTGLESLTDFETIDRTAYFIRYVLPWALVGLTLIVGGIIGLVKALQAQRD